MKTTDIVFRLPRTKNAATVYLRVKGITPVRFAPSIESEEDLRNHQLASDMLIGLAMGGQFSLAVFNLVLFAAIRDRSYLSYGVFQILTVLLVLNGSGYTYEWFLTDYPMLDLSLTAPLGMLTSIAIVLFSADFLHIGTGLPRSVVRYFIPGLALFALLSFAIPLRLSIRYSSYIAVAVCLLVFWLAIIRHRAGFGPARFFFVAFLPLLAFAFTFVISRFLTFIKTGPFSLHIFAAGLPLAILLSSVLFSVALSDRFQTLRNTLRKTLAAKDELRMRNEQALREEKHRINRELHDVIGSDLSALIFELRKDHEHDTILTRLNRMLSRLRDLVHINALDPDFDVASQIRSFLNEVDMPGLLVDSSIDEVALPVLRAFHLHRIFLESVTNCLRHANATNLIIRLKRRHGKVTLLVADNGCGFDVKKPGNGMTGLRERAQTIGGHLRIVSRSGKGTVLILHVSETGAFLPLDARLALH